MSFVHLHTHTHYTFQRALGTPEKLAERAKELGQTAIAITDAGNMYGAFEFYVACREAGVKPIIGVEFTISKKGRQNRDKDNELYEIVLLARNYVGYKNLIHLVTFSQLEGYYNGKARIDFDLLEEYADNLIALSGSMYGEIGQHIIIGKSDDFLKERMDYYSGLFPGAYFLEIEEHLDKPMQSKINETILRLSHTHGYEFVGTNNSYYIIPEDAEVQDMMSSVADGRALEDPGRSTLLGGDYSIRSSREMEELFVYASKAYDTTLKIAEMIDLEIDYGEYKIPTFPLSPEQKVEYETYLLALPSHHLRLGSEEWMLRKLCIDGLNTRYEFGLTAEEQYLLLDKVSLERKEKAISAMNVEELYGLAEAYYPESKKGLIANFSDKQKDILKRLEYELTVVDIMGFNAYFCIVADFIRYGKQNGVPVGPGRGSAAGAILAYLSGITDIDPLRYGLLFERFLNPSRVSMPDIDVDFSDDGREKVLLYVREKYGADHVAQVCTFGTLAARAAVKDAGRALGIPFGEMNEFAKLIPSKPGTTLRGALDDAVEFRKAYTDNAIYKKVIDSALRLEGSVRQLGVHACAVIIAPDPMTDFCPLQHPPKDPHSIVTQFSAGPLEALGLLKMDFLGLKNLTILARAQKIVQEIHERDIDLLKLDYEDPRVLALFGEGDMTGVFQFESSGMRRYLKELKPSSFEDLIAMVSLYRPGPMQYIPEFIDRKFGRKTVEYPHPSLEAILKPTYGIAVYQEQIMQLVQAFAGFSLGEADILRRAIGKKKYDLLMEQRSKFILAARLQGHPEELAIYIFDEIIEPFAGYGFNKSHAACYAMIAFQTGYMKTYYATEFMTALLVSDEEDSDRIRLEIEEARERNIEILPPDVNESRKHFTFIDASRIRFGLKAIKGLGEHSIDTIRAAADEKEFSSIHDFIERTGSDVINKKSLESLVYSGALDRYGERASLLESIPQMISYLKEIESKKNTAQIGLFDTGSTLIPGTHFHLKNVPPMSFEDRMKGEKSMIGYPVSGHPLDGIEEYIRLKSKNTARIYDWIENHGDSIVVAGMASELSEPNTSTIDDHVPYIEPLHGQLIGLVHDVRKIQTKSGGMMLVAKVESVGFDFRLVVFTRDYETYESKVLEDTIVIVDGKVKFDEENDEISISPSSNFGNKEPSNAIKCFSISAFRDMAAQHLGVHPDHATEPHNISNKGEEKYSIQVPAYWTKDDLLELRLYLESATPGANSIWINIGGQEKDTKFAVTSLMELEEWIKKR